MEAGYFQCRETMDMPWDRADDSLERSHMKKGIRTYSSVKRKKKIKRSLQAAGNMIRRVFLCLFRGKRIRAVLTVEAAFVVPLFLLGVGTVLGMMDVYRIQAIVRTSLHQSAEELGMYAGAGKIDSHDSVSVGVLSSGACIAYAKSHLPDLGEEVSVSLLGSCYENHRVRLRAVVTYRLPVSLLPVPMIKVVNTSTVTAWTGFHPEEEQEENSGGGEMVYVSDYESVYHTSSQCTHLDLSVHQGSREQIETQRNIYGKKYHACEKCKGGSKLVYYTEKGDCYHSKASCSGLKRTVRLVEKTQIRVQTQCERCKEAGW